MALLFEGALSNLPENLNGLIDLRIKIERWWILNIDIPTNPDFDSSIDIGEDDIQAPSQLPYRMILDIVTGYSETSNAYYKEFLKHKGGKK